MRSEVDSPALCPLSDSLISTDLTLMKSLIKLSAVMEKTTKFTSNSNLNFHLKTFLKGQIKPEVSRWKEIIKSTQNIKRKEKQCRKINETKSLVTEKTNKIQYLFTINIFSKLGKEGTSSTQISSYLLTVGYEYYSLHSESCESF